MLYGDHEFKMIAPYRLQACNSIHQKKSIVTFITLFWMVEQYNIKGSAMKCKPIKIIYYIV